ncbi:hypothetical protein [Halobellus salinisoli]|uniref:hypothetical protein n=1 Tax=Halobellus salinisoli TaxID=3108500 RepID=UPI003008BEAB
MPSRRGYLATLAAAGLAGCVGSLPGTSPRPAMTIEAATVQHSYHRIVNVDSIGVRSADGQFVFVAVDTNEVDPLPSREDFSLVADGERYDHQAVDHIPTDTGMPTRREYPIKPEYVEAEPRGWLLFDVPAPLNTAPSLRLQGDNGSWQWDLDLESATAPPPAWEWTMTAPETITYGEDFYVTVTGENVGKGLGTFRGSVVFSSPTPTSRKFEIVLQPGESADETMSASIESAKPGVDISYDVRTSAGESGGVISVADESSSTESPE